MSGIWSILTSLRAILNKYQYLLMCTFYKQYLLVPSCVASLLFLINKKILTIFSILHIFSKQLVRVGAILCRKSWRAETRCLDNLSAETHSTNLSSASLSTTRLFFYRQQLKLKFRCIGHNHAFFSVYGSCQQQDLSSEISILINNQLHFSIMSVKEEPYALNLQSFYSSHGFRHGLFGKSDINFLQNNTEPWYVLQEPVPII